ncbi:MBL fold metallo-hydrolase [Thiohalophilus sp.]|uniref:MBL fold metallo-hydrolase n=1 Tax=Thiohalophilus sp. TaxID=3028392 RepID=UPI003976D5E0
MTQIVNNAQYSIDALELGPMENFIYVITDHTSGRAAVVDPAWEVPEILALAEQRGINITDILLTHSHHDHINGVEQVLQQYDAQLHLLKPEAKFWGKHLDLPTLHHGGDTIKVGDTEIRALHTPGHTPGSACYHIHDQLITGDTMFVWGCGRCDLSGGDPEQMYDTLNKLAKLPGNTTTLPGHNYADQTTATMEEQIQGNPFMHFHDKGKFVDYRMHIHDRVREEPYHAEPADE